MGDAGGDPDWYGYCLDDPVNGVDPLGLSALFRLGLAAEKAWRYTKPIVETGKPPKDWLDLGTEGVKRYGKDAIDWYLDTVDDNVQKIQDGRRKTKY